MKYVWRLAFLAVILVPIAHAEVKSIKKRKPAHMRAFDNLHARLASLENYSVVYADHNGQKRVMKSASGRHKKGVQPTLELRPSRKKF